MKLHLTLIQFKLYLCEGKGSWQWNSGSASGVSKETGRTWKNSGLNIKIFATFDFFPKV